MKMIAIAASCVAVTGCAGINYILENYRGVEVQQIAMPDDTYRIFDKPSENRMMVTSSFGSAAGQGVGRGLFLGAMDTTPPGPLFEAAANRFLETSGRPQCKAVSTTILVQPQFEVKYRCDEPRAAPVAARQRRAPAPVARAPSVPMPVPPPPAQPAEPE